MDSGDGNCLGNGNNYSEPDEQDALGNARMFQQEVVARTSTPAHATHYKMDHPYRGRAIILNHESFHVQGLKSRSGTQVDCDNISKQLKVMGFDVTVCKDFVYSEINRIIMEVAGEDHSRCDCLLVVVMSHGEMGILYAKDAPYKPELLWTPFTADRCPSLAGKPKLFLIQACQGDKLDGGVTMSRTETDGPHGSDSYRIPSQADFLIAYSTIPGYYSWRNTTRGSWFMQALCEEIDANIYNLDILTLLTFVNRRVALDYESNTPDNPIMHKQKQIPCITSMLTRILKFTRKGSEYVETGDVIRPAVKVKESSKTIFRSMFGASKTQSYQVNSIV